MLSLLGKDAALLDGVSRVDQAEDTRLVLSASLSNARRALLLALRRTKVLRAVPALSSQKLSNKS